MTEQKQPHEGEIWRKPGPMRWYRIERNDTPEAPNYDGGLSGFAVRVGNFSSKRKRVYWSSMTYFITAQGYDNFVAQMKEGRRYLMHGGVKEQKNEL